jgi:transcriptional regulator with XRE-family HTH domain
MGEAIRVLRERCGLSHTEFGGKLGVSLNSVSRWERGEGGKRGVREGTLARLADLAAEHNFDDLQAFFSAQRAVSISERSRTLPTPGKARRVSLASLKYLSLDQRVDAEFIESSLLLRANLDPIVQDGLNMLLINLKNRIQEIEHYISQPYWWNDPKQQTQAMRYRGVK